MLKFTIDVSDAQAALARLDNTEMVRRVTDRVIVEAVQPELAKYPGQRRAKQPFKSAKSRKYFFAALKKGRITVPYQRSGALGSPSNWTRTNAPNGATLTSTQRNSDLVLTKGKQAKYHEGNWPTTDDVAQKIEGDTAELIGTAVVIAMLEEAGLT